MEKVERWKKALKTKVSGLILERTEHTAVRVEKEYE